MLFLTNKNHTVYRETPFGAAIYNADVSVGMIAQILGVSRQTVYGWLESKKQIGFINGIKRAALTKALDQLVAEGLLPSEMNKKEKRSMITSRYAKFNNMLLSAHGERRHSDAE